MANPTASPSQSSTKQNRNQFPSRTNEAESRHKSFSVPPSLPARVARRLCARKSLCRSSLRWRPRKRLRTPEAPSRPATSMCLTGDRSSQNPPAPEEEPPRKQPTRRIRIDLCSSTRTRGNDAALQAAWGAICRPEEYVRPGEREEADIAEARNRGRGKAAQK